MIEEDETFGRLIRSPESEIIADMKKHFPYQSRIDYKNFLIMSEIAAKHKWFTSDMCRAMMETMHQDEMADLDSKIDIIRSDE